MRRKIDADAGPAVRRARTADNREDAAMKTSKLSARWSARAATVAVMMLSSIVGAQAPATLPVPLVKDGTSVRVSEHVYVIPDKDSTPLVPNIGIVVGSKATLVVDTGLGQRNGETVWRE